MRTISRCRFAVLVTTSAALIATPVHDAAAQDRSSGMQAAEKLSTVTFKPIDAISYVLGSKRAIGYFEPVKGECRVTLMISEVTDPDVGTPPSAARVRVSMLPAQSAMIESAEGDAMMVTCGAEARTLDVKIGNPPKRSSRPSGPRTRTTG